MSKIVTIHQPDFMPWIGFFVKVWRADIYVVLDHVVNNIRARSWFRRMKLLISGQPKWISIPIVKPESGSFQPLNKMRIRIDANTDTIFSKYMKSFERSYSKAPYYLEYRNLFFNYFENSENMLTVRNMQFILNVLSILNFNKEIIFSSELNVSGSKTELLINIVKKVGGNVYLCGDGAAGYQDDTLFAQSGIKVIKNNFYFKEYKQVGTKQFVPGLSIIDLLVNEGAECARRMIESYGKLK